jgi:hypothetical protein
MNRILAILGGLGLGAGLMYLYDPKDGQRRRALLRDKAVGLSHEARTAFDKKKEDLSNRAQGVMHNAKLAISSGKQDEAPPAGQKL